MQTVKQIITYTAYSIYLWSLHDVKQQIRVSQCRNNYFNPMEWLEDYCKIC